MSKTKYFLSTAAAVIITFTFNISAVLAQGSTKHLSPSDAITATLNSNEAIQMAML